MRALLLVMPLLCGCASEVVVVDPPAHVPLQCRFELDEAFSELTAPGGIPITQWWEIASTPRGVLYAPVQKRINLDGPSYLTGVARFDGKWSVEPIAGAWWQIYDVAADDDHAWIVGDLERAPTILERSDGAWRALDVPEGIDHVARLIPTPAGLFALATERETVVRLFRRDPSGWTEIAHPVGAMPTAVRVVGSTIVVGLSAKESGTLARLDGDRLVPLASPVPLPPVRALSGTGLGDLLVLGETTVHWLDLGRGRGKLVHQDRPESPFGDVWSARPGVALLAPSYYRGGRITVLDGAIGPREVEVQKDLHFIARFAPEGDGKTVHFLTHDNSGVARHVRAVCP